jgi:two-component system response regulator NreC
MPPVSDWVDPEESFKTRVLLMDDNGAFLRAATGFLQRHHELIVVGPICGGEKALAQALDLQPHVILIDLDRTALETIPRLRNTLPGVGIIALTLLNDNVCRQAAITAGAFDLAHKAELITNLLSAIRRVTQISVRRRR